MTADVFGMGSTCKEYRRRAFDNQDTEFGMDSKYLQTDIDKKSIKLTFELQLQFHSMKISHTKVRK